MPVNPIADAGTIAPIVFANLGNPVALDGSASNDPEPPGDPIAVYQWYLLSRPAGSAATIVGDTLVNPVLTPDVVGSYLLFLVVEAADGRTSEVNPLAAPDIARVTVTVTTEFLALTKPAAGDRNWHTANNAAIAALDALKNATDTHADVLAGAVVQHKAKHIEFEDTAGSDNLPTDDVEGTLETIDGLLGDVATLTTTATDLTGAINEIDAVAGAAAPDSSAYLIHASSVPAALANGVAAHAGAFGGVVADEPDVWVSRDGVDADTPAFAVQKGDTGVAGDGATVRAVLDLIRTSSEGVPAAGLGARLRAVTLNDADTPMVIGATDWIVTTAAAATLASKLRWSTRRANVLTAQLDLDEDGNLSLVRSGIQQILKETAGGLDIGINHGAGRLGFYNNGAVKWMIDSDFHIKSSGGPYRIEGVDDPTGDLHAVNRQFLSTTHGQTMILFGAGRSTGAAQTTNFLRVGAAYADYSTDEDKLQLPFACVVKTITVWRTGSAPGGDLVFTVRKNGVDTALTVTMISGDTDDVGTHAGVSFSAGDFISVQADEGAGTTTTTGQINVAVHYTATA